MRILLFLLLFCGFITSAGAQALRPGDLLEITVLQDPKLDRRVIVGPEGMIAFPLAGHIHAAGMTPQGLENVLRERLKKNYNGALDITVALAAYEQRRDMMKQNPEFTSLVKC